MNAVLMMQTKMEVNSILLGLAQIILVTFILTRRLAQPKSTRNSGVLNRQGIFVAIAIATNSPSLIKNTMDTKIQVTRVTIGLV
jgi:cellobiose-specific phosphotransferase system component IIC